MRPPAHDTPARADAPPPPDRSQELAACVALNRGTQVPECRIGVRGGSRPCVGMLPDSRLSNHESERRRCLRYPFPLSRFSGIARRGALEPRCTARSPDHFRRPKRPLQQTPYSACCRAARIPATAYPKGVTKLSTAKPPRVIISAKIRTTVARIMWARRRGPPPARKKAVRMM